MRSRPGYFIFWFPAMALCAVVTGCFALMWANAPEIPSQGMEALVGLPYYVTSLVMAPFLVGLGVLLWKRPQVVKPRNAVPTVVVTLAAVAAWFVVPRSADAMQTLPMVFVDRNGQPVDGLRVKITRSSAGFDLFRGGTNRTEEEVRVDGNRFVLAKKRGMEAEVRVEKDGYYHTSIEVRPASRDTGLQMLRLLWVKDWGRWKWGVDGCTGAMNWPLEAGQPFRVVMLELSAPAVSPIPEYTDEDFQELQSSWNAN